jgi:HAD superfamily hydrolase (TIGR01509 family)
MDQNVAGPRLRALIFDVDGTLAETEELHRRAFNETFAEFGLNWHWDTALYRELLKVTGGKERLLHFVDRHRPAAPDDINAKIPRMHTAKNAHYGRLMAQGELKLRPGVARLVREAATSGLQLAIATTTSRTNLTALLAAAFDADDAKLFAVKVVGEDVKRKKPDPEVYTIALARLGLAPAACIAFEDSHNGVISARGAGLPVIVAPSAYTDHERFDGALAVVSDLGEPDRPYRHLAGAGEESPCVSVASLCRWCAMDAPA